MSTTIRLSILLLTCWLFSCVGSSTSSQTRNKPWQRRGNKYAKRYKKKRRRGYHCTYKYGRYRPYGLKLRTSHKAPPFVKIRPTSNLYTFIRLSDRGPSHGAYVSLYGRGINIRGTTAQPVGVRLYVNRPTMFGRTVIASQSASLKWQGYRGRRLTMELRTGTVYRPRTALLAYIPCEHSSIVSRYPKTLRAASELPPAVKKVWLRKKVKIPVSSTAGGEVEGELFFTFNRSNVDLIEEQDLFAKVYVSMFGYAVFGWIPKSALLQPKKSVGVFGGGGLLGSYGRGKRKKKDVRRYICSIKSSLYVKYQGELKKVGWIRRRTPFEIVEKGKRWTRIRFHFWDNWARLTKGHTWVVPSTLLSTCHMLGARKT